jgi:hypothetical protein
MTASANESNDRRVDDLWAETSARIDARYSGENKSGRRNVEARLNLVRAQAATAAYGSQRSRAR